MLSAPLVMVATVGTYLASALALARISPRGDLPSPENRRRARELGVRTMVAKPVTRRKLLDALTPR